MLSCKGRNYFHQRRPPEILRKILEFFSVRTRQREWTQKGHQETPRRLGTVKRWRQSQPFSSRTSRTFVAKAAEEKGFGRKLASPASSPCRNTASSAYPLR